MPTGSAAMEMPWRFALVVVFGVTAPPELAADDGAPQVEVSLPQPLFLPADDGAPGVPVDVSDPFTRSAWVVTPNVIGIAQSSARVDIPAVGGVPALAFSRSSFEPRDGFSIDDAGNVVVDDDPRKVGYYWYGRSGRNHLFLTVHRGNVHAMVYGPLLRLGIQGEPAGTVLRELDAAAVDAGGCATEAPRALPVPVDALRASSRATPVVAKPPGAGNSDHASSVPAPKHTARIGLMLYYTDAALAQFPNNIPENPPLRQLQRSCRESG